MAAEDIREIVKERYGQAANAVAKGSRPSCCGPTAAPALLEGADPITRDLYSAGEASLVPADALAASLGCGNPTALAELSPGEIVLDLGSGGGIDVLLSARRVGPAGKAYGLDMTPEMLELARANQKKAGVANVEFLQGTIEAIPLPDASVDVIISNCVINLSADKDQVLREAFRVLRPGGRLAVSDVVIRRELPASVKKDMELWTGCIAGALLEDEYRAKLAGAGFAAIDLEPTRVYGREDALEMAAGLSCCGGDVEAALSALDGAVMSAFVRARKPVNEVKGRAMTTTLRVFDPPMCCGTGVCGPSVDPELARFSADLDWLKKQGVAVERYNLAQEPGAFVSHDAVKDALAARGDACLPLVLVDERIAVEGAYPSRETLAALAGVVVRKVDVAPSGSGCCGPSAAKGAPKTSCC